MSIKGKEKFEGFEMFEMFDSLNTFLNPSNISNPITPSNFVVLEQLLKPVKRIEFERSSLPKSDTGNFGM